jgi:hypothetical protein
MAAGVRPGEGEGNNPSIRLRSHTVLSKIFGASLLTPFDPAISRKLRLLRAHGLIHKLPHTHRYQVTENGRLILKRRTAAGMPSSKRAAGTRVFRTGGLFPARSFGCLLPLGPPWAPRLHPLFGFLRPYSCYLDE